MASVRVVVASPVGLHARPAASFVRAVQSSGLAVSLSCVGRRDGGVADARSILAVLSLDVGCGEEVELSADGEEVEVVLTRLAGLLAGG
jgi:phosphocarrier protein